MEKCDRVLKLDLFSLVILPFSLQMSPRPFTLYFLDCFYYNFANSVTNKV